MERLPEEDLIIRLYNIKVAMEGLAADERAKTSSDNKEVKAQEWLDKAKKIADIYIEIKKNLRGQENAQPEKDV